jgi:two-component system, LuxR family, response regulator FixJ
MNDKTGTHNKSQPVVYVVDDDDSMRRAVMTLIKTVGYSPVAYSGAREFLAAYDENQAGCLLLDVRMPGMSGLELQQELGKAGSILPIIFMTGHGDVPMAVQAMKEGAFDFLQKPFRDQDLIDCLNRALKVDAENRASLEKHADIKHRFQSLTPREVEVMEMLVDGRANKVIAIDLGLSERTVEIHRANVMEKMGVRSVAHLVRMKLALGDR